MAHPEWILKPAMGNVVVKPMAEESVTKSGLYLPAPVEKDTYICEVVEVCDPYSSAMSDLSVVRDGPVYAVGDLVVVGKYTGRDIKIREEHAKPHVRYIIIRESDVLATLVPREQDKTPRDAWSPGDADSSGTSLGAVGTFTEPSGRSVQT